MKGICIRKAGVATGRLRRQGGVSVVMLGLALAVMACAGCTEAGRNGAGKPNAREMRSAEADSHGSSGAAPHVNSLGMRFVPVPILGGPTGGQTVMFCIWETRVRDYAAFVHATGGRWTKPAFEQADGHPAVNVSWEDANAFCAWLTGAERAAGLIDAHRAYRLPTDHEWSCAVGIGERENAGLSPERKDRKIRSAYPWGNRWPPPLNTAGNLGEEALARELWEQTAPVGCFAPNRFGLFDLAGNAWEWCEDKYTASEDWRVLRGGSWEDDDEVRLRSSARIHASPDTSLDNFGFRCVLADAP